MSLEPVRSRPGIRLQVGEAIAAIALLATFFSASQAWVILPEKVRAVEFRSEKQDGRLSDMERLAAERAETLARIDERTKRIEEALRAR